MKSESTWNCRQFVRVDKISAIFMLENIQTLQQSKNLDTRLGFVNQFVSDGFLKIIFVRTRDNGSCQLLPLTKRLTISLTEFLRSTTWSRKEVQKNRNQIHQCQWFLQWCFEATDTDCGFFDNNFMEEAKSNRSFSDTMPQTSERATLLEQLQCTLRIQTITRAVRAVECDRSTSNGVI